MHKSTMFQMHETTEAAILRDARRQPRLEIGESPFRSPIVGLADVVSAWPELAYAERKVFGILTLDSRNRATRRAVVSVGLPNSSLVHPREVFRLAIILKAAALILVHNHPSGDVKPSEEDLSTTRRLREGGQLIVIRIRDHVINGGSRHYSFQSHGHL